ncbi:MAG: hypothetical protein ACM3KM_01310 [Acidobacteriaceae bacterium]
MNRSGLPGSVSSAVFSGVVFLFVVPFALKGGVATLDANWVMAIGAGVVAAVGVLQFNGMLAKAIPQNVGTLFVLMIVVQVAIPAIYQVVMTGLTVTKAAGFLAAIVAAILLSW